MAPSSRLTKSSAGSLLVEIILGLALMALIAPTLINGLITTRQGEPQQQQRLQAIALLKQTRESLRIIREKGWDTFSVDGIFHPQISGSTWNLLAGTDIVGDFTRSVAVSSVYRNEFGNISNIGLTQLDPSTKKIDILISWTIPFTSSIGSTSYLTRYLDNVAHTETTIANFSVGTTNGTAIVATGGSSIPNDGQIQLGAGGYSDWCAPTLSISPADLPGNGLTTAISAASSSTYDFVYTTTGFNASGNSLDSVIISHTNPPTVVNTGVYNYRKTYGIYVDVPNQFVYLASNHPGLTVDIVQVSTLPYTQTGTFQASGGQAGNSVYAATNSSLGYDVGYVTAGSYLYTYNLSSKSGSRAQIGQVLLGGTGGRVLVVGNYAFVTTNNASEQMDIIDVTNPANMTIISRFNTGNSKSGVDLYVNSNGTRVYLVTAQGSPSVNNFFIINTTNKSSPTQVSGAVYNTGLMSPKGVALVPGNRVIIVGSGGEQYQVINIDTESNPVHCGGLTNPYGATAINAIAGVQRSDGSAYSYILTNTASQELQLIQGGPGGSISIDGTYTSAAFNPGYKTAFNYFQAMVNQPDQTTIKIQVAVAAAVSGSCTNAVFTYLGPDGNPSAFFTPIDNTISATVPFDSLSGSYQNPGQCFRYKVYFNSTDTNQTPIFNDISVNYSP